MQDLFQEIYQKYYTELCIYACRFVQSDAEAEEIVQEVITNLWENRENLQKITSIRSYLYRSVYNRSLNYLNHLGREKKYRDRAWVELKKAELEVTETIFETELEEKINYAVNDLPERCREVFEMSRYKGLKNKEIAEVLNITIKAVEGNISRALRSLRKSLKDYIKVELILIGIFFIYLSRDVFIPIVS